MSALVFIAFLILGPAAAAMSLRNLIHSALLLVASWFGIAAFYLWAGAEFVAFAQVLIYVGAISMVVLFAVLLTRQSRADAPLEILSKQNSLRRSAFAALTAGTVCGVLCIAIFSTRLDVAATPAPTLTVQQLGTQLMGPYTAALLVVGLLLTVALLGAVVLAASDERRKGDSL